jgi:energy-coupling factor transporter ATP-binding protein EcfA2
MTFTKFVCWNRDSVRRVMEVEATQASDWDFLATHYPIPMYRQELIEGESQIPYSEEQFLKDFLASKDFAFVPVLGESGTGKSHLIRWLSANIQSTKKRKVILIPKIGTNLKDILVLILEGMEGNLFDEYRKRLNDATSSLTEAQAREQLLNQLAAAVGPNGAHDSAKLSDAESYLVDELGAFLYDPFFREEHWLKKDGIIDRLVIHILGHRNRLEIIEERRQFSLNDLPLEVRYLEKAGKKARDFYSLLIGDEEIQKATVEWLNQHLDEAIARVLSLGREDLQRLMREVREALAKQDIELILLIEDFAKLQGIDREVLEAVLARPEQPGGKRLCPIRTALACTTGYFQSLIETVRQRVNFSVTLNAGSVKEQSLMTRTDIQQFVAKYLNAVRLQEEELQNWYQSLHQDSEGNELKSACSECEHNGACHGGFAAVNNIGLYPFTPKALEEMLGRVNTGNFNPRILIKDVLKWTLENSVDDVEGGQFPSTSLREHFGKPKLSALLQDDINRKDPQNGERRAILLDLWTDGSQLVDLPEEVHAAFEIPPLGLTVLESLAVSPAALAKEAATPYEVAPKTAEPEVPDSLKKKLQELDNWNNQGILSQDLAKDIREFIHPAIVERIEWNTEMLLQGTFAGSKSDFFKTRNVTFHSPKVTRETIAGVRLSLPLNPEDEHEFRDTAIAFQGILQYKHYKHWNFPEGDRYFSTYSKYLERWSQYVLEKIRLYPRESGEPWNPVPAAVELLAIGATMAGHPTNSLGDLINSLFLDLEAKNLDNRSKTWKKLFETFQKNGKDLLEIVTSRIACTKGSSEKFQIIDTVQILEPLQQVSQSWQPQCEIPDDVRSHDIFKAINKTRQQVDELLEKAIQEERDRLLDVYDSLVAELGENFKKKEVIEEVKEALDKASEAGVLGSKNRNKIDAAIDSFDKAPIVKFMEDMKRIKAENKSGKLLPELSQDYQKATNAATEFIKVVNDCLDNSLSRAETEINNLSSTEGATLESIDQAILEGFATLKNLVTEIKG